MARGRLYQRGCLALQVAAARLTCLLADHSNHVYWWQQRIAQLGAYQPTTVGQTLHGVERQIKFHRYNI